MNEQGNDQNKDNIPRFSFVIDDETKRKLAELAELSDRSMGFVLRKLINDQWDKLVIKPPSERKPVADKTLQEILDERMKQK